MKECLKESTEKIVTIHDTRLFEFIKDLVVFEEELREREGEFASKKVKVRDREYELVKLIQNFKVYEESPELLYFLSGRHKLSFPNECTIKYEYSSSARYVGLIYRIQLCLTLHPLLKYYMFCNTHKLLFNLLQRIISLGKFSIIHSVLDPIWYLLDDSKNLMNPVEYYGLTLKFFAAIVKFYISDIEQQSSNGTTIYYMVKFLIFIEAGDDPQLQKMQEAQTRVVLLFLKNYDKKYASNDNSFLESIFYCCFNKTRGRTTKDFNLNQILKSIKEIKDKYNYNAFPFIELIYTSSIVENPKLLKILIRKSDNPWIVDKYIEELQSKKRIFRAYYRIKNKVIHEKLKNVIKNNLKLDDVQFFVDYFRYSKGSKICYIYYPCLYAITELYTSSLDRKLFSILFYNAISGIPGSQLRDTTLKAFTKIKEKTGIEEILYYRKEQCQGGYVQFSEKNIIELSTNMNYVINPITYIQPDVLYLFAKDANGLSTSDLNQFNNNIDLMLDKLEKFPKLFRNIFLLQMLNKSTNPKVIDKLISRVQKIAEEGNFHELLRDNSIFRNDLNYKHYSSKMCRLMSILSKAKIKPFKSDYFGFHKKRIKELLVFNPKFVSFSSQKSLQTLKSICNNFEGLIVKKGKPVSIDEFIQKFYIIDFTLTKIVNIFFQIYASRIEYDCDSQHAKRVDEIKNQFEESIGNFNVLIKLYHFYILLNGYIMTCRRDSPFIKIPTLTYGGRYRRNIPGGKFRLEKSLERALAEFKKYYGQIYCPELMDSILLKISMKIHERSNLTSRSIVFLNYLKENPSFNMSNILPIAKSLCNISKRSTNLYDLVQGKFNFTLTNNEILNKNEFIHFDIQDYERLILNPEIEIKKQEEEDA